MAYLVKCSLCGRNVSNETRSCPGCGNNVAGDILSLEQNRIARGLCEKCENDEFDVVHGLYDPGYVGATCVACGHKQLWAVRLSTLKKVRKSTNWE